MKDYSNIIEDIKNGNTRSQEKLYTMFSAQMYSLCLRYLKNREDAEDVFQNAFLIVFNKIEQLKDSNKLAGWIKTIFVNECLRFLKDKTKFNTLFFEHDDSRDINFSNLETAIDTIETKTIINEIKKLPNQYRIVLNLYVFEGYKHKEIAEKLGISLGTSKSNLHDARKLLYSRLEKLNAVKTHTA